MNVGKKKTVIIIAVCLALTAAAAAAGILFMQKEDIYINTNEYDQSALVKPETWALTDGLGRAAPLKGEVKERDDSKFVGLFYWTWHTEQSESKTARNVTRLMEQNPDAIRDFDSPLWEGLPSGYPHFWDEPVYGYYVDTDEYVLRKQAELIADAGVDVIFFDCTNGTYLWESSYEKLFQVFERAKEDGVRVPKIAFMLPFWDEEYNRTDLINLYNNIYSKDLYRDLWFFWDGKPIVMGIADSLDKKDPLQREILDFFTFRAGEPAYFTGDTKPSEKKWGWCSDYPQAGFGVKGGNIEQMCVSVAQNAADGALVAMNADANVQGRAFSKDGYSYSYNYAGEKITATSDMDEAFKYGLNFQQQWDYAIEKDPEFIFVTGWNEWIAGRWEEWQGTENAFPDQFNYEFSRDCEPSAGILKDYYYCQLVENIRRFKGISDETEESNGVKTYYHYTNSTLPRANSGWGDTYYENNTMRNDFTKVEVSDDGSLITMRIYTEEPITQRTDSAWMRVFVDTDFSGVSPSWEGFEYVINRENADEDTVMIERSTGGWEFEQIARAVYSVSGNVMTLEIPVESLGLDKNNVSFRFKLSDNMQTDGDIMDFYLNGDVAPGGRFTFVYNGSGNNELS